MPAQHTYPFPTLITNRLQLRKLSVEDAHILAALRSNDIVNQYLNRPKKITAEEATEFINKTNSKIENNELLYWAITLKSSDTLIGTTCLFNFSTEKDKAEIGYELHPDFHGKGLMNEAISRVINYGFSVLNVRTIIALTKPGNLDSVRLLTKNNFSLDKDFELFKKEDAADFAVFYVKKT
jgi:ribosomal-protein-alanine N-acetyltransferase